MSRAGEELAELLWDASGPALRTTPPPFQPFTCSAAGSTRAHAKRHAAMDDDDLGIPIPMPPLGHHHADDDDADAVPWLHCPVIDDGGGDSDTAPLPPEYCAGLQQLHAAAAGYPAAPVPDPAPPPPPPETQPLPGEGVMNFTFFSRPLQRAPPSTTNPLDSTVVQTAASRLRNTPLFSEQRMAWLQPPPSKAPAPASHPPPPPPQTTNHHHHVEAAAAATVTQHHQHRSSCQPHPDARRAPHDAMTAAAVTTSSVCSGNGDRFQSHQPRSSSQYHHQPTGECSVSQDEDMDDEPSGAARVRSPSARGTKRTRTAEVHNLSERRRRDRINEKMRALQELIPNCNKIDKASMLEEAIEYLKTLQLQVQMMSMGTGLCMPQMLMQMPTPMAPFPHLGMGLGFGMGPAAAAFDMLPRFAAAAQFPCPAMMPGAPPPMAMPPHAAMAMFGMPGGQVMPSPAAFAAYMNGAAPPAEPREATAAGPVPPPGEGAGAGDHPPAPVALQGDQKLQHPKQTT